MRWTLLVLLRNCYMWPRRSIYLQIKNLYIWMKTSITHSIIDDSRNPVNLLFVCVSTKVYWINYYNLFFWEIDYNYCPLSQWHVVKKLLNTNLNYLEKLKHTIENSKILNPYYFTTKNITMCQRKSPNHQLITMWHKNSIHYHISN
jgi:hypothetical protein